MISTSLRVLVLLGTLCALTACPPLGDDDDDDVADDDDDADGALLVELETTMGVIVVELYGDDAPISSANFLEYVDQGFYDGTDGLGATIFHRVISGFMIQTGGLVADMTVKATNPPIVNESDNGLSNSRGTLGMARTSAPNSATSQFYVNHVDNEFLDLDADSVGYAVFGEVVEGMEVVDEIAGVGTGSVSGYDDVPLSTITITSATRL